MSNRVKWEHPLINDSYKISAWQRFWISGFGIQMFFGQLKDFNQLVQCSVLCYSWNHDPCEALFHKRGRNASLVETYAALLIEHVC